MSKLKSDIEFQPFIYDKNIPDKRQRDFKERRYHQKTNLNYLEIRKMAKSVCHNLPKLLLQHNRVLANNAQNGKTLPELLCKTFHTSQSRLAGT